MFESHRIATAEYALDVHGAHTEETPFGLFVHNRDHPDPKTASRLIMAKCAAHEVDDMLYDLASRCSRLGLSHRHIAGYDPATFEILKHELPQRGFTMETCWAWRKVGPPRHPSNPDVTPWVFIPARDDRALTIYQRTGFDRDSMNYYRRMLREYGGMEVIAFMDRKTVGVGGWYTVDGVTRLMPIATRPSYQGRGVATAVINFITQQPDLEVSEAMIFITPEDDRHTLYEQMGFARNNMLWQFVREENAAG